MPSNTRNLRHGSLQLRDGQAAANTLSVPIEEGDLSFTESKPGVVVKHRGGLDHWSKGEEIEVPLSFTIKFVEYISKTSPASAIVAAGAGGEVTSISVREFLTGRGVGGALLTTKSGRNDVFTIDAWFTIANPALSGDQAEVLKFLNFNCESVEFSEGAEYNTIRVSGRALITAPTGVRS
jgi:hypothetical protein